ncbi:hypothetical protein [Celerinatantimonas sp. YJH-8]|uniref:hypothetical protein n=1 Tax=Celerinatantimonas sp. YJH-8 TaxID=3228714 RepID=UPI0038C26876
MLVQSLLRQLVDPGLFAEANKYLAQSCYKALFKPWLTLSLSYLLGQNSEVDALELSAPYQDDEQFWRYQMKPFGIRTSDRNHASKADIKLQWHQHSVWTEVQVFHQDELGLASAFRRLEQDFRRVERLHQQLPMDQGLLLVGFWGSLQPEHIQLFRPFDNNVRISYVLDSRLSGSSQVARLSHIQRAGQPRFCLIAFMP